MRHSKLTLFCLLLNVTFAAAAAAEEWPCWRGPRGDGTAKDSNLPQHWDGDSGENIRWKIPVPGSGHASPILWQDRLFLATCFEDEQTRALVCLDARNGKQLWRADLFEAPLETIHALNSRASGTPATDGQLVYVAFLKTDGRKVPAPNVGEPRDITPGRIVVSAVDFEGHQRWQVDVGPFLSAHGFCTCPVLYDDLVIINGDHDGDGYLVALDKSTGQQEWRTPRKNGIRSYVTPIIRNIGGRDQLVMSGSGHIAAFDPRDGSMIWMVDGPCEQFVSSMVFDGQRFIMAAGYPTHHVMAIRPDGTGDVTDSHVAWHVDQYVRSYVPSPVLVGQRLFVADDRGTASSFRSADGTRIWQARLGSGFNASLVASDRFVYFLSRDGVMKIVKPADQLEVVAENRLDEICHGSPAISRGRIFIRGDRHLYCIAQQEPTE